MNDLELLRDEMSRLGMTTEQQAIFESDPGRARAAIAKALLANASKPIAYALAVFRSESSPVVSQRQMNRHGLIDPTRTDDGERIWQWHEVDDEWKQGYLRDCWRALTEGREPAARYQPSQQELNELKSLAGELQANPKTLRETAQSALRAWQMLWFGEPA